MDAINMLFNKDVFSLSGHVAEEFDDRHASNVELSIYI